MFAKHAKCSSCDSLQPLQDAPLTCAKCHHVLDIEYDLGKVETSLSKGQLPNRVHSLWRYRDLLPVEGREPIVTLGEGMTPLKKVSRYADAMGLGNLTVKLDYLNPTGSFKDRGATVMITKLKESRITSVIDDSSGNAGASVAAYCASAGIDCTIFVPATAPKEKLVQTRMYGAKVQKVEGTRADVETATLEQRKSSGRYYASHNLSPFFLEGLKTVAYEIAEVSNWQLPDSMIFPVGTGGLLLGVWKGLKELLQLGWVKAIPRIHCVQSEACQPIVNAFQTGNQKIQPVGERETVAGGIRISKPARGEQVLQAIKETHGAAISVSDQLILKHQRLIAETEGIFVEPTSCAALAGLEKLCDIGLIASSEAVVIPLTGFGLKDTRSVPAGVNR